MKYWINENGIFGTGSNVPTGFTEIDKPEFDTFVAAAQAEAEALISEKEQRRQQVADIVRDNEALSVPQIREVLAALLNIQL